ncbi:MAG: 50S ribosomal protein L21 [Bacillota bacterium]
MFCVIETGGKQYRVKPGDVLKIEKLKAAAGDTVEFDRVLSVTTADGKVLIGTPYIKDCRATAVVLEQGKGRKIIVFKYKSKVNYRRKTGHRQPFTKVRIEAIQAS